MLAPKRYGGRGSNNHVGRGKKFSQLSDKIMLGSFDSETLSRTFIRDTLMSYS